MKNRIKFTAILLFAVQSLRVCATGLDVQGYPLQWNDLSMEEMFKLPQEENFSEKFLKQWMNAMEACYEDFKKSPEFSGYNFSRTIDSFKGAEPDYKEKVISIAVSHPSTAKNQLTWTSNWFFQTTSFLEKFNARSLGAAIHGLSYLRVKPEKKWAEAFLAQAYQELPSFKNEPKGCSIILLSLASLRILPSKKLIGHLLDAALSKNGGLNPQEVSNVLYALALLDYVPEGKLTDLKTLVEGFSNKLKPEAKHQIFLFHQHLKQKHASFLTDKVLTSWTPQIEEFIINGNKVSQAEKSVCDTLKKVKSSFEQSVYIPEIASMIDFYDKNTKTIIQFDGPFHFLSDGSYDGSSVFQDRLLREFGYNVKRLSYKKWQDSKDKQALLKSLLKK